jgi:hypothetical protein
MQLFTHFALNRLGGSFYFMQDHFKTVVPKRCVGRDNEVCREIKKKFKLRLMMIINNWTNDLSN